MAVNRESWLGGSLCRARGVSGQGEVAPLSQQGVSQADDIWSRLEPGAKECRLILTTEGVKAPDLMEEHGETVPLKRPGEPSRENMWSPDQLLSLSQPSVRIDSLEEAGEVKKSMELAGLRASSLWDELFKKRPELTSAASEVLWKSSWEMPGCLLSMVSMEAGLGSGVMLPDSAWGPASVMSGLRVNVPVDWIWEGKKIKAKIAIMSDYHFLQIVQNIKTTWGLLMSLFAFIVDIERLSTH